MPRATLPCGCALAKHRSRNGRVEMASGQIHADHLIETCEAGNHPAAVAAVNAAKTVKVVECIYRSLWTRLVVIVARAYAENTRPGDLHVQYAFDLLKDSSVRAAVELRGNPA